MATRQRHPALWAQNISRRCDAGPTGGESIRDVMTRVRDGLLELELRYASKTIAIVAHGFVAEVVRALSSGSFGSFSDIFEWRLPSGSVLSLENFAIPIQDADTLRASLHITIASTETCQAVWPPIPPANPGCPSAR
ncbi:histidine phosphatase family protein [Salinicola peritrichatus]|uniref:histidine phosphatase family protein n=1 Tax=Salinicola peritrichatus TaxID=1267424 RepID=UPI000DA1303F